MTSHAEQKDEQLFRKCCWSWNDTFIFTAILSIKGYYGNMEKQRFNKPVTLEWKCFYTLFSLGLRDCHTHCCTVLLHKSIWGTFSQQMSVPHETNLQKKPETTTSQWQLSLLLWQTL